MPLEKLAELASIDDKIEFLKDREEDQPEIDELKSQWDIKKHAIHTDLYRFPDITKDVKDENGVDSKRIIPLTRIGLPYQKRIVQTGTTFYCGNPITYSAEEENEKFESFKKVLEAVKSEFIDAELREAYGRWTECAEHWYTQDTEEKEDRYGFESEFKIRCNILTPDKYKMYPIFDDDQDLVIFSVMYKKGDNNVMEVFTKDNIVTYEEEDGSWAETKNEENVFGLIPINFLRNPDGESEWHDVQDAIERLEYIYSATGESNNDFAFPLLTIHGEAKGAFTNKQGGRVLQFDDATGGAQFVHNPASDRIDKEREVLERDIYMFTDTPDISLSNMQGLGNILSGVGVEFLFLASHQKVARNNRIFEPALKRRISIINAILNQMNTSYENQSLEVKATVNPFTIDNFKDKLRMYLDALSGEQIFSLKYVLSQLGIENPEGMITDIIEEAERKEQSNSAQELV